MNLSGILPKNQASDWLTYLVDQLEAWYLAGGNSLNSCPDSRAQKKLTLMKDD